MILLFAPTMPQAVYWCRDQRPPINPNGKDIRIFTPATAQGARGRHLVPGEDRVVIYNEGFVFSSMRAADRERWHELMDSLKRVEYFSPGWDISMREYAR